MNQKQKFTDICRYSPNFKHLWELIPEYSWKYFHKKGQKLERIPFHQFLQENGTKPGCIARHQKVCFQWFFVLIVAVQLYLLLYLQKLSFSFCFLHSSAPGCLSKIYWTFSNCSTHFHQVLFIQFTDQGNHGCCSTNSLWYPLDNVHTKWQHYAWLVAVKSRHVKYLNCWWLIGPIHAKQANIVFLWGDKLFEKISRVWNWKVSFFGIALDAFQMKFAFQ